MSLINDALNQARKSAPRNLPPTMPLLQPVAQESAWVPAWFWPAIVVLLIAAAIFFIGWAVAHRGVRVRVVPPKAVVTTQPVAAAPVPAVKPPPVAATPVPAVKPPPVVPPPPPVSPPALPKLQGIFYSPTAPSAIVDGKSIRPGDHIGLYRVKAISKYSVTLIGPDKKEAQLTMGK